jgi:hypothetical protein
LCLIAVLIKLDLEVGLDPGVQANYRFIFCLLVRNSSDHNLIFIQIFLEIQNN